MKKSEILEQTLANLLRTLNESSLSSRYDTILEKIKAIISKDGGDEFRNLLEMLKISLKNYVKLTNDHISARGIYNRALHKGKTTLLPITTMILLANTMMKANPSGASKMIKNVLEKLNNKDNVDLDFGIKENASASAVSAGNMATGLGKKKKRKDSIFAEGEVLSFPTDKINKTENHYRGLNLSNTITKPVINPKKDIFYVLPHRRKSEPAEFMNLLNMLKLFRKYDVVPNGNDQSTIWDSDLEAIVFFIKNENGSDLNQAQIKEINQSIRNNYEIRLMREQKIVQLTVIDDDPTERLDNLEDIMNYGERPMDGILLDPTTAELILSVHQALNAENQQKFIGKPITEMLRISNDMIDAGLISVIVE